MIDNNGDYGGQDCGNQNKTVNLIGCPEDYMKPSQIAGLPILVGTWHYVNSSLGSTISGKIVYGANGDVNMTVPNKTAFGDYTLESSWGYIGNNILTQCYAGGCENSTLTTVTPNHIEFRDNHGDLETIVLQMWAMQGG